MKRFRPKPFGWLWSARMRPTSTSSRPVAASGSGKRLAARSSTMRMPGAAASTSRARASLMGVRNVRLMDSLCARSTGTRTQVALTRTSGLPQILRVSSTSLRSSSFWPSSPMTLLWLKRLKRYWRPKMAVSSGRPADQSCAWRSSSAMAAAPAPDADW